MELKSTAEMNDYIVRYGLKQLLDNYIKYTYLKFLNGGVVVDPLHQVVTQLNGFINGNVNAITRDNQFRQEFEKFMNIAVINFICSFNIEGYVKNVITENFYLDNNSNENRPRLR